MSEVQSPDLSTPHQLCIGVPIRRTLFELDNGSRPPIAVELKSNRT